MNAQTRMKKLSKSIRYHNKKYYVDNAPEITDEEYNSLYQELLSLEKEYPDLAESDSPTMTVGDDTKVKKDRVKHYHPMLSLSNCFTEQELSKFIRNGVTYSAELKFDGLALGLYYSNGVLTKAVTRGDGIMGEDVTRQASLIEDIPKEIDYKKQLVVRGEVYMSKDVFSAYNDKANKSGGKVFVDARNAAAGTLRAYKPSMVDDRKLNMFAYSSLTTEGSASTHLENLELLSKLGFHVCELGATVKSLEAATSFYKKILNTRDKLPFGIDGVVYKVNDLDVQANMGDTGKYPRWATAYKFPAEEATTVLESIDFQVGRFGSITPVGRLKPVFVGGATVSSVTLHNIADLRKKDIRVGDTIVVKRSGDVIPHVVKPILDLRPSNSEPVEVLDLCPCCGSKLYIHTNNTTIDMVCENHGGCEDQIIGQITNFVSRDAMDIDGIGKELIVKLYKAGLINRGYDIYSLKAEDLMAIDGVEKLSSVNITMSILRSMTTELHRVIYALGIPNTGRRVSKLLANKYMSLDRFCNATVDDMMTIDGIGRIKAESVFEFLSDQDNLGIIEGLDGILSYTTPESVKDGPLRDKRYAVTGTFQYGRSKIKEHLELLGAKVSSGVSSKTTAVIAGDKPGTSKIKKAGDLGVPVVKLSSVLSADLVDKFS